MSKTEIQSCVVHQICNSLMYVAIKDQKAFISDLKPVYQAESKDQAELELVDLEEKWSKKYPVVIESWQRNWEKLTTYYQYTDAIRKLIYTTNTIEGFHRQKSYQNKGSFYFLYGIVEIDLYSYSEYSERMDPASA